MKMSNFPATLVLVLASVTDAFAVWPPSTALDQDMSCTASTFVVIALVIGIVIGIWIQRSRHERQ